MQLSGNFNAPVALSPGKEAQVPFGKETRWMLEPVWNLSENLLTLPEIKKFLGFPASSLVGHHNG
jgi:hypothetical protein